MPRWPSRICLARSLEKENSLGLWRQEEYKFGDVTKAAVNKAMVAWRKTIRLNY